jgi:hypothetical protein
MAPRNTGRPSSATIIPFPRPSELPDNRKILRIVPDFEGNCLLYSHHALSRDKLFAIKILCWAQLADGSYVALVPWLKGISRCTDLIDADSGKSQGYYNAAMKRTFSEIPPQYEAALEEYPLLNTQEVTLLQEVPDLIGSHAAMISPERQEFNLEPVISWKLFSDGRMEAMIVDKDKVTSLPVLAGDPCLYSAESSSQFRYFFQYHIANQIKAGGQVATRALQQLLR